MAELYDGSQEEPLSPRCGDECAADAAALVARLGADGVDWLDRFLADYVFADEPLDRVLVKARELSQLPGRSEPRVFDD
jgi:hypothetical protein